MPQPLDRDSGKTLGYLRQIRAIAGNTWLESIRQPLFSVLLLLGVFLLAVAPAFSSFTLEDDNKLLVDIGLSTIFVAGLFLAAFTAAGVVNEEIERKTVLTVVSKPVPRPIFILGKYLGVLGAVAAAHWIWGLAFLLAVRHQVLMYARDQLDEPVLAFGVGGALLAVGIALVLNYRRKKVFGSTLTFALAAILPVSYLLTLSFDKQWQLQSLAADFDGQLVLGLFLLWEAEALLCAVAVAASTRFGQMLTVTLCSGVFLAGLTSDYLLGRFAETSLWARGAYAAIPNLQYHWLADALTQGSTITVSYLVWVSAYSALYILGTLALAVALFQTREVG